ncbi:MAG: serine hydrolase [Bryobacteraceae bacterium]|jgi:CubicO group peptidase (beta-lactamase class C family)
MRRELGIGAAAVVLMASQAKAQATDAEIRQILVDRVDVQHKSVGIVVGIITPQARRVVAYGRLDQSDPRPVDGDTVFEIGSVTKVFTSLLLADMVERGEATLADPVAQYLPPGTKTPDWKGRKITLADLATHTSGLPFFPSNFPPVEDREAYGKYTVEQLYQFLATYELPREPGTQWEYSNTGGGLLGLALGRRAGMDYEALVRKRITGPLGMESTGIALPPRFKARLAAGQGDHLEAVPMWDLPALPGAGSLRSSANDLLTLLAAFTGAVKSPLARAMAAMPETRRPNRLYMLDQALGWFAIGKGDEQFFIHGGGTFGFSSSLAYDPRSRTGVVVLSNAAGGVDDIARHVLRPALPLDKPRTLKVRKEVAVDPKLFDVYAGRYRPSADWVYTVTREGDSLRIQLPAAPKFRLHAESERDYFIRETDDIQVTFQTDAQGRSTGLILHIWGFDVPAPRIEGQP